jgi:hypothetical protein
MLALQRVADNDDCTPVIAASGSCTQVFGVAGTEYFVQVDGFGRQRGEGLLVLTLDREASEGAEVM